MTTESAVTTQSATPDAPSGVALWWKALTRVAVQVGEANMFLIAAGVAFFGMFSLFPGLAALIALWGLVSDPNILLEQIELLREIVPAEVFGLVEAQILALMSTSGDTLGWAGIVSVLIATWSARSGVAALMMGLNTIHGRANRNSIRHYVTALLLTVALFGVSIVALGSVVVLPIILKFVPLGMATALMVSAIRWLAAIGVLLVGLALLYRYGPNNRHARMRWVTPGAGLAVVLWAIASWGFSLYLTNFASYNEVYGSIGAAIALMMWLYVSAFVVLLGAALNVQLDRLRKGLDQEGSQAPPAKQDETRDRSSVVGL
ncbi:MAG: YihY/virulence factor BrkB family protein [Pseudooceanicola sp.]